MTALAASDLFFRWTPDASATLMRVHHPLPGVDIDVSPTARFWGYPPAQAPPGVVTADDSTNRFITVINGFPHNLWHRDVSWSLGVPASNGQTIYSGVGGIGAVNRSE